MARKKPETPRKPETSSESDKPLRVMVSRRVLRDLWERFQRYCAYHVPRTSDTAMMEQALREFLDRHEDKK